jgi:hypothetical protein
MAVDQRRAMWDRFKRVLRTAMAERGARSDEVRAEGGYLPGWVLFERQEMFAAVNRARAEQGRTAVPMDAVERVEQMACGHVDYFDKYTLYCAELALGVEEVRP